MKWKSLLTAALTAVVAWPALAQDATGGGTPSLSFSFANNRDGSKLAVVSGVVEANTELGVEPVPANKWIELYDSDAGSDAESGAINNTETISANDERAHNFTLGSNVTVTYSAKNAWSVKAVDEQASSNIQPFLQSYLDDGENPAVDGNTVGAKFTVTGIPFESYDVIIYFASDKTFAVGSDNGFLPVTVNGTAYSWTQWQSETDSGYLVSDADSTAVFGSAPENAAILGKNAIRIPALSGDLSVVGAVGDGQTSERCSIAAFQIIEAKPSININFAQTAAEPYDVPASDAYGLEQEPGAAWQNIYGSSGTDVPLSLEAYGLHTDAKLTFSAPGTWRFPNGTQVKDPILRGFLGTHTNAANGSTVSVSDIPFTQYDVIVYFATNEENAVFQPVTINGKAYTWNAETQATVEGEATFGASGGNVAIYGTNALRIPGLTGNLTLATGAQTVKTETEPFKTGNLCGIQIICTGEVTDAAVPLERNPTISVNFARGRSNGDPIVSEVAGSETQALAVVPADAWTNLYPSNTDCDDTVTLSSIWKANLTVPVRVSYQANGTWSDNVEGRPAFLKTFLGDGAYGNKIGSDILVSQIPFSEYEAIVYLATDTTSAQFLPVEINGKLYKGNGKDATVEAATITETYGDSSELTPTEGVNVIRVGGLSGDLRIKGSTQIRSNDVLTGRCNIAAFQIVCTGDVIVPEGPDRGVISLNYASGTNNAAVPNTAQLYGLEAAPGTAWADLTGAPASTQNFTAAYGASIGQMSTTFSAGGTYQYGADQNVNPFMRGYLDDNSGDNGYNHVSISVPNIPFDLYDVIVYTAVELSNQDFKPVQVNGTYYTFDDAANGDWRTEAVEADGASFGQGNQPIAKIGVNAIRVNNQDAQELSVNGQSGGDGHRGGIAAIQIIERPVQEITVNTETTAQKVFAQALPGRATKLAFAEGGAITGAVNLSGVAVDLTQVTTSPFSGNLTVDANTKLYLPAGTRTYALTTGTVAGTLAAANVFIGGTAIPADAMTQNGANLTFDIEVTYNWTGAAGDNLWSTPDNWSSGVAPGADSVVTVPLDDGDAKTIVIDTAEATANLFYISGPQTGSATLEIVAAENVEGAKLTVVENMLTTGKVAVTQRANVAVNGATQTGDVTSGDFVMPNQAIQAGFQVNGAAATYTIASGELLVQVPGTDAGDVSVSNGAILEVGADATLSADRARITYYGGVAGSTVTAGTLRIAGQATFSTQMGLSMANYTVDLAGGTMTTPSVRTFNGLSVSAGSTLAAPAGKALTVFGTTKALTGAGSLTLQGEVTFSSTITADYTGELTAVAGSIVTLGENRPKLSVAKGAEVLITPTTDETAEGSISFATSMTEVPSGATFTVSGVEEEISPSVVDGVLTLTWAVSMPTLAISGTWSTVANWTNLADGADTAPSTGTVILDGTGADIRVMLDTALTGMESILVRGDVTLVTTDMQSSIPTCVTPAEGAVLTIGANISGASLQSPWVLPAGTTLKVSNGFTSFAYLTLNGAVEIAEGVTGPIEAPSAFDGGLTVNASGVTLTGATNVGVTLALNGNNIAIQGSESEGSTFYTDNGTTVVNTGAGNAITGVTGLSGAVTVENGTLQLTLQNKLNSAFPGATIAEGATLTLAGPDNAQGWWFPATGAGTLELESAIRPMFAAVSGSPTLPKTMVFTATEAEQTAGVISCVNWQNGATLPEGFAVKVNPAPNGGAWVPNAVLESGVTAYLRIYNKLPTNLPVGVEEAIAEAIQQAAETAGLTKAYTVQLTTKGQPVEVTADMLNDVLGCFTNLTATAEGSVLTYAYNFGITGIKRNTADNGWVVTAKVQGENAEADFAAGNVYTLTVNGEETTVTGATVGEGGTVTLPLADTEVQGDGPLTLGVKVSRPEPTPAQ